jgi:unsaturated chondroitin disaccharide hydrolase
VDFESGLANVLQRVSDTVEQVGDRFPLFAEPIHGRWTTSRRGSWAAGFWVGLLWLRARCTSAPEHVNVARQWCAQLAPRLVDDTATRAMIFWYGAALGQRLFGDRRGCDLGFSAARRLVASFRPDLGLIPLGTALGMTSGNRRTSIDCVGPMVALLRWAHSQGGGGRFLRIARQHVGRHVTISVLGHGAVICRMGIAPHGRGWEPEMVAPCDVDGTGWSRGQAWALLALAEAVRIDDAFVPHARRVADYWLSRVPHGALPAWHFGDPEGMCDSSAAVIAAVGLLELDNLVEGGSPYQACAHDLLRTALCSVTPIASNDDRPVGMLLEGCYDHRQGIAMRHELVWGDFFLVLALAMVTGRIPKDLWE